MHLQEKIYKAIQKGLTEALDFSFDDEDNSILTKKRVSDDQIVRPFEVALFAKDNCVDLGLSSGTLWCMHNLGATCKNTPESWYGHYYMWGSTKPNEKDNCCWQNAPFNNGEKEHDEEYFNKHIYEFVDHNYNLLPEYDAAYQTNNLMHIPTKEQLGELCGLWSEYVENYNDIEGLNGRIFYGNNGNTLFIPAAGWFNGSDLRNQGSGCSLWSSRLNADYPYSAYNFFFQSDDIGICGNHRSYGFSIRPVLCQ